MILSLLSAPLTYAHSKLIAHVIPHEHKAAGPSSAPEEEEEFVIEWYAPETVPSKNNHKKVVRIKGYVDKQAVISITKKKFPVIYSGSRVKFYKTRKAFLKVNEQFAGKFLIKNSLDGSFQLDLLLPIAVVQLPLRIRAQGVEKARNVILKIDTTKSDAQMLDRSQLTNR